MGESNNNGMHYQLIGAAVSDANPEQKDWNDFVIQLAESWWVKKNICSEYPTLWDRCSKYPLSEYTKLNVPDSYKGLYRVEVQSEALKTIHNMKNSNSWDSKNLRNHDTNPWVGEFLQGCITFGFVAVHAPTRKRDLSSLDDGHRVWSIKETISAMDFARYLNAIYFIIHGGQYEYSECDNGHRGNISARMDKFFDSFTEISHEYIVNRQNNYKILLENLEKPKFPYKSEEFEWMLHKCREIFHEIENQYPKNRGFQRREETVYMILDIPHFIHNELKEHGFSPDSLSKSVDYLNSFINANKENIKYYHMAGCKLQDGNRWLSTHDPVGPVRREYGPDELNLERVLSIPDIQTKPLILEVFNVPLSVVRDSIINVREFFGHA